MQYVVSQIKHDTGEVFYNTIKPKDNEVYRESPKKLTLL